MSPWQLSVQVWHRTSEILLGGDCLCSQIPTQKGNCLSVGHQNTDDWLFNSESKFLCWIRKQKEILLHILDLILGTWSWTISCSTTKVISDLLILECASFRSIWTKPPTRSVVPRTTWHPRWDIRWRVTWEISDIKLSFLLRLYSVSHWLSPRCRSSRVWSTPTASTGGALECCSMRCW